jgi:hypothetical protein
MNKKVRKMELHSSKLVNKKTSKESNLKKNGQNFMLLAHCER